MKIQEWSVSKEWRTRLVVGSGALKELSSVEGEGCLLVSTRSLYKTPWPRIAKALLSQGCRAVFELELPDGEEAKSLDQLLRIIETLYSIRASRKTVLASVGGGAVGDVSGFAASIYMRGIRWINVPTTLLAMIDSGLGGKTAIDTEFAKNVLGTIYQPSLVVADLDVLETLPARDYIASLGEALKYSATLSKDLYELLDQRSGEVLGREKKVLEDLVATCANIKMKVVAEDPFDEKGVRLVLNYGHTIGHAIEAGSKYMLRHGEAVAIGCIAEAELGVKLGVTSPEVPALLRSLAAKLGLPTSIEDAGLSVDTDTALRALLFDKKRAGNVIKMPFPTSIGSYTVVAVDMKDVAEHLKSITTR